MKSFLLELPDFIWFICRGEQLNLNSSQNGKLVWECCLSCNWFHLLSYNFGVLNLQYPCFCIFRELSVEERDARTVFCMQLSSRIRSRDLEDFFSVVGKVNDVRIITDTKTRRSKGIAYVEFVDVESVPLVGKSVLMCVLVYDYYYQHHILTHYSDLIDHEYNFQYIDIKSSCMHWFLQHNLQALGLSGQKILGVPIVCQPTQAEKNRAASSAAAQDQKAASGPMRLYVGSLHFNITEDMLRGIFEPFGKIDHIQLIMDSETGRSKGYGFITVSSELLFFVVLPHHRTMNRY